MSLKSRLAVAALLGAVFAYPSVAQDTPKQITMEQAATTAKGLKPQNGRITLAKAHAVLDLGTQYDFYGPADTRTILVDIWRNPPESANGVLGMVLPAKASPLSNTWGAVVTYEDTGYVSDEDATTADFGEIIEQMKEGAEQANPDRKEQGYPTMHVIGWAENPKYDAKSHSVVWASDIKFDDTPTHTLNYDLRTLGRNGVLSVNFLSSMEELPSIKTAAAAFASHARFDNSFAYSDFNASTDKKAEYGIGGLVAAGAGVAIAKKLGFLAILLKFLKPILIALVAGFAFFRNKITGLFGRNRDPLEGYEDEQ